MGSGKTSVGRALAKKLRVKFMDSDDLVEGTAKLSVREIFLQNGEQDFRRRESLELSCACATKESAVLAVAGGAILAEENRNMLKKNATCVVWLDAPTGILVERTGRAKHRPLLDADPTGALTKMRDDRESLYRELATHKVATQKMSVAHVVDEIITVCDLRKTQGVNSR